MRYCLVCKKFVDGRELRNCIKFHKIDWNHEKTDDELPQAFPWPWNREVDKSETEKFEQEKENYEKGCL